MFGSPPPIGSALSMAGEYCRQICTSDSVIFYPSQLNQSVYHEKSRKVNGYLKGTGSRGFLLFKSSSSGSLIIQVAPFRFFGEYKFVAQGLPAPPNIHDTAFPSFSEFYIDLGDTGGTVTDYTLN